MFEGRRDKGEDKFVIRVFKHKTSSTGHNPCVLMRAKTHYVYIGNIASCVSVDHLCQVLEQQTSHYRRSNHHPVPGFEKGKRLGTILNIVENEIPYNR